MRMRMVRFVKGWRQYNAGERAGFVVGVADRLIATGVAVPVEPAGPARGDAVPETTTEAPEATKRAPKRAAKRKATRKGGKAKS